MSNFSVNRFRRLKKHLINGFASIYFNRKCLYYKILPKYSRFNIKNENHKIRNYIKYAQFALIKNEINIQYKKVNRLNMELLSLHLEIANNIDHCIWNFRYNLIQNILNGYKIKKFFKIKNKLNNLLIETKIVECGLDSNYKHNFFPRFVNLSNVQFSQIEIKTLENSTKTNFKSVNSNTIENLIVETECAVSKLDENKQDEIRTQATSIISKFIEKHKSNRRQIMSEKKNNTILKRINHKLSNNNLTLIKADKSNTSVIISNNELEQKTLKFLDENNCTILRKDPTSRYHTHIDNLIKNNPLIFDDNVSKFKLKVDNPSPPKLNTLIKLHKKDKPVRPLINSKTAPNYNIGKYITKILKEKINLENKFNIKNTYNLIDLLKDITVTENTKLYSFDINNMYTNIPIKNTIDIIQKTLLIKNENKNFIKELTCVINTILSQNYFKYNNNIYQQNDGLAMGAPTSAIISEIFLQDLDKKIVDIIKENDPFGSYYRYVDDTLYISQNKGQNIHKIIRNINKLHDNIKFKIEEEFENKLNFLDLTIVNNHNSFNYSIFRKITQSSLVIPFDSIHPPQHKLAAFNALIYRMYRIPLAQSEMQKERSIIFDIALENGYNLATIRKLEYKIKNKIYNQNSNSYNRDIDFVSITYSSFTYIGYINNKISKLFNNTNVKVTYNSDNTNFNRIKHKTEFVEHTLSGVYKIECPSCNKFYVGQTKKKLLNRFLEHRNAYLKPQIYKSNLATHCLENKHGFPDISNVHLVKHIPKGLKMNIWENLYIFKFSSQNNLIKEQKQIKSKFDNLFKIIYV